MATSYHQPGYVIPLIRLSQEYFPVSSFSQKNDTENITVVVQG